MSNELTLEQIRHSASHILAQAVLKKYPKAKLGIGPTIEDGFYYDFDLETPISDDDLVELEASMKSIIKENQPFKTFNLSRSDAEKKCNELGQPYKLEIIKDLNLDEYSFYENGPFLDLCKGPHIRYTKQVKAFKLLKVSGAYWKGSEKNKMLQRIYGTAFLNKDDLQEHLTQLEEAQKRDHRVLGKALDLFSIQEEVGGGLVLWHPKGARIRHIIETYWKDQHFKSGYELLYTPHIGKSKLWETSGHLAFYKENMYTNMPIDEQDYYIRPMNCPFHIQVYQSSHHSYRDLPIRYAELGTVYRYERSGVLHGLMRVRGFTQDDAHIICTKEQAHKEISDTLHFCLDTLKKFNFNDYKIFISTKPEEKSVGENAKWDIAQSALEKAVKESNLDYEIDEGGGAFYGPKIDIKIKDAIGRYWQCSTIQFDFNLPETFNLSYINSNGEKEQPFMIHRALLGSLERFFGILIEHHAGKFPLWLAPVQVKVLTLNADLNDYANDVINTLKASNVRCELDLSSEKLGYKIRQGITEKIPYLIVIGKKEVEAKTVSIRGRDEDDLGSMELEAFKTFLETKGLNP